MITRRGLFQLLAGVAASPFIKKLLPAPRPEPTLATWPEVREIIIGQYADYYSFDQDCGAGFLNKEIAPGTVLIGWIHPQFAADLRADSDAPKDVFFSD